MQQQARELWIFPNAKPPTRFGSGPTTSGTGFSSRIGSREALQLLHIRTVFSLSWIDFMRRERDTSFL